MLHIILLILKILGLLILGILGLIVFLAAVVLLAPAGYCLEASGKDTPESLRGRLKFHWLFHLISGEMQYEDGRLAWRMRAGWKKFGSGMEEDEDVISDKTDTDATGPVPVLSEKTEEPQKSETEKIGLQESQPQKSRSQESQPLPAQTNPTPEKVRQKLEQEQAEQTGKAQNGPAKRGRKKARKRKRKKSLYERLKEFWEKIKYTFHKICDNIRALGKKKERLTSFVRNEVHKSAFLKVMRELRCFLKTLRPRKAEIYTEFGFTDPALTGYALALISMIYPFVGECTEIRPDFEHRVLRGRIYVKGRIRAVHIVAFALRLLTDKNVRTTYRHIRKFKL